MLRSLASVKLGVTLLLLLALSPAALASARTPLSAALLIGRGLGAGFGPRGFGRGGGSALVFGRRGRRLAVCLGRLAPA